MGNAFPETVKNCDIIYSCDCIVCIFIFSQQMLFADVYNGDEDDYNYKEWKSTKFENKHPLKVIYKI